MSSSRLDPSDARLHHNVEQQTPEADILSSKRPKLSIEKMDAKANIMAQADTTQEDAKATTPGVCDIDST